MTAIFRVGKANSGVRNYRICHLKSWGHLGLLMSGLERRYPSLQFDREGGIEMNGKILGRLVASALTAALALASPALARGGGHGGGGHGGGHFAGSHFAHAGSSSGFSRYAYRGHRFHGFGFVGVPFAYAAYNSCWRKAWTPYGLRWVNVCHHYRHHDRYDYGYDY
jgi:hypothetical protein